VTNLILALLIITPCVVLQALAIAAYWAWCVAPAFMPRLPFRLAIAVAMTFDAIGLAILRL
jgi:hypothetical protein